MSPEIIVMLTHNDVTVDQARDVFRSAADLDVTYWGFKDVGLPVAEMERLVADFTAAGKVPVLEVVSFEEDKTLDAAQLAIDCGIEYFTGARYSDAVRDRVQAAGLRYFPFAGNVGGHPIALTGTLEAQLEDVDRQIEAGVDGVDLVAYRYADGDPVELANAVVDRIGAERSIVAGSINSVERIRRMHEIGPFGYTIGGALFEGAFKPGESFRDNLAYVVETNAALSGVRS